MSQKYSDLSKIGEGSFGRVYKATEKATKKVVALKVIAKVSEINLLLKNTIYMRFLSARKIIERSQEPA